MIQGILLSIYWLLVFSSCGNTSINPFTIYFKFEVHATTVVLHDIQSSLAVTQFMNVFYFSFVCLFIFLVCHLKNKARILMNNHFLHFLYFLMPLVVTLKTMHHYLPRRIDHFYTYSPILVSLCLSLFSILNIFWCFFFSTVWSCKHVFRHIPNCFTFEGGCQ